MLRSVLFRFAFILVAVAASISLAGAQDQSDRVWIAGRYDGNRVIVYFSAVKFGDPAPENLPEITAPLAMGFFSPVELPQEYIARFQKNPKVEPFHLGEVYDLQMSSFETVTVKLTTLLGFVSDEPVGNDSYIGALATLTSYSAANGPILADDYYILRPHVEPPRVRPKRLPKQVGYIEKEPLPFATQTQIAVLLEQYRHTHSDKPSPDSCDNSGNLALSFVAQSIRLATGERRYYVRAGWKTAQGDYDKCPNYVHGFWLAPQPTLHILAVEDRTSGYAGFENVLPNLAKVVDLGGGKTGLIVHFSGADDVNLVLFVYREGARFLDMTKLQAIGFGE